VFDPQPFENPLRRMPLFGRRRLVGFQDRINHRNEWSELRPLWSLGPQIAGRAIVSRLNPKTPAASRRLFPATNTNRRTAA
jgi:hypothetical protein